MNESSINLSIKLAVFLLAAVVLLFPLTAIHIDHALSTLFGIVTLLGLVAFTVNRFNLTQVEKIFYLVVIIYVLSFSITYIFIDASDFDIRRFKRYARCLAVIPIVFLLTRIGLHQRWFWYGMALGAIGAGAVSLVEVWHLFEAGHWRYAVKGNTHHIIYGNLSLLMAFIALVGLGFFKQQGKALILIPIMAFILGTLASMLSGARGGWVALPFFIAVLFLQYAGVLSIRQKALVLAISIAVPTAVYFIPQTGVKAKVTQTTYNLNRYFKEGNLNTSLGARFAMWADAWGIFLQHPVVGAGPGRFVEKLQVDIESGKKIPAFAKLSDPHNEYLRVLAAHGLVGIVGLLVFWGGAVFIFLNAIRSKHHVAVRLGFAGMLLIIAYSVFGISASFLDYRRSITFFCMVLSILVGMLSYYEADKKTAIAG